MRTRITWVSAVLCAVLASCAATPPPEAPPPTTVSVPASTATSTATASPSADATPIASTPPEAGPRACGCSLCEPVVSDDACTKDADCAPSVPCHAPACIAVAKAHARRQNEMCTQMMACLTADANRCECLQGKCALSPRK